MFIKSYQRTLEGKKILREKQLAVRIHFFTLFAKYLKDNKQKSLYLVRIKARIFVVGHYFFLDAYGFPRASLLENCSQFETNNVQ